MKLKAPGWKPMYLYLAVSALSVFGTSVVRGDATSPLRTFAEIEVIRERFDDGSVKIEREVTLDADGNYVNHGTWKMWNPGGDLIVEGHYNMGKRVGTWTRWHDKSNADFPQQHPFNKFKAPFVSQAGFNDDVIDGDWIIFDSNQEKCVQIALQDGRRHGPLTMWLPGGGVYREEIYDNGVLVGDVNQRGKDGQLKAVAKYIDGRRVSKKVTYFDGKKNKKTEAQFLEPRHVMTQPDDFWGGRLAKFDESGKALRHGPWTTWYSNGQLQMQGHYQQDKEIGSFTWWHPNGQQAVQGEYNLGTKIGRWVWWHANGQKSTIGEFNNGEQVGRWRKWYTDGQLEHQTVFDGSRTQNGLVAESEPEEVPVEAEEEVTDVAERLEYPVLPWMQQ